MTGQSFMCYASMCLFFPLKEPDKMVYRIFEEVVATPDHELKFA